MSYNTRKVVIWEEAPGIADYRWFIPKYIGEKTVYFQTLEEAKSFCTKNGVEFSVEHYQPT